VPHSSVILLLGFSAMVRVDLVSRVTARSLHDNMLGCLLCSLDSVVTYTSYAKAKFRYASWFGAGSEPFRSRFGAGSS